MSPEQIHRLVYMTPDELRAADMKIVLTGMLKAQKELEANGVRQSWFDPYVQIARQLERDLARKSEESGS